MSTILDQLPLHNDKIVHPSWCDPRNCYTDAAGDETYHLSDYLWTQQAAADPVFEFRLQATRFDDHRQGVTGDVELIMSILYRGSEQSRVYLSATNAAAIGQQLTTLAAFSEASQ